MNTETLSNKVALVTGGSRGIGAAIVKQYQEVRKARIRFVDWTDGGLSELRRMPRLYDHIDLRVRNLAEVRDFYEVLLPALGFMRETRIPNWFQYEAAAPGDGPAAFFGVTESPGHVPNENRIAFWAESPGEVDRLASIATGAGAQNVEGPGWEDETYYAVFFEDPCGNRLEICHRTAPVKL